MAYTSSNNINADVLSDNRLYLEKITLSPGEIKEIPLLMTNANEVKAVQGNIKLPDGIVFVTKPNGRLDVKNINERSEGFTLSCALQENGSMSFAHYSADGFAYERHDGGIFTFKITADESIQAGDYDVVISDIVLSINGVGYEMAERVSTITIEGKTPIVVTAKSYTREYGEDNPSFEYESNISLIGQPEIVCAATKASPVGTYDIIVSKGSLLYENVTYEKGTLTITQAPLTISVGNYVRKIGTENPSFEPIYSGFKNGETEDVLTRKPTVTCAATVDSPEGQYDIIVNGAEAQNYKISYGKGTLTIRGLTDEEWLAKIKADLDSLYSYAYQSPLGWSGLLYLVDNDYEKAFKDYLQNGLYYMAKKDCFDLLSRYESHYIDRPQINDFYLERILPEMKLLYENTYEWLCKATLICNEGGYIVGMPNNNPNNPDKTQFTYLIKLTNDQITYNWIDWRKAKDFQCLKDFDVYWKVINQNKIDHNIIIIPNEGYIIKCAKQNGEPIEDINYILFSEKEEVIEVEFAPDPVGIQSMKGEGPDTTIYNLSGQRLSKPQRGVNIVGGKKVVVK